MYPDTPRKKILFIIGTRPEAIKFAPLILKMKQDGHFNSLVCFTGQHREMLDQTANFFDIKADYNLSLMTPNQTLVDFLAKSLVLLDEIIKKEVPDLVFVQGDTSTVLSASLAAYYNRVKLAHLEAGLRSQDKYNPFPEEINRVLCSRLADFHFAPTVTAQHNLNSEGIHKNVYIVGNTVIDALHLCLEKIGQQGEESYYKLFPQLDFSKKIILVTCHRRENFGEPLLEIISALREFAISHPMFQLVYPVHLNPNVKEVVNEHLGDVPNIFLIPPAKYPVLIWLMSKSYYILTDSGGIQEEAPALGKPVLVLREVTERTESLQAGTAVLVGHDKTKILHEMNRLSTDADYYSGFAKNSNPYGLGNSSGQIMEILKTLL